MIDDDAHRAPMTPLASILGAAQLPPAFQPARCLDGLYSIREANMEKYGQQRQLHMELIGMKMRQCSLFSKLTSALRRYNE